MATQADVKRARAANARIAALAQGELEQFWDSLDLAKPEAARDALLGFMPQMVARYGDAAATFAADWFDDLRASSGARGRFRALMADAVSADAVEAQVRFAAGHLFGSAPTSTLDFLLVSTSKYVLAPGRETIATSVRRDPGRPTWARVPTGAETCDFCLDLASRGAVYGSEDAAGGEFHGNCDCVATPIWDDSDLPDGYDPGALYEAYQARQSGA